MTDEGSDQKIAEPPDDPSRPVSGGSSSHHEDAGVDADADADASCAPPSVELVDNPAVLLSYGVCRVPIPVDRLDPTRWARELSTPTPLNMAFEGDGEYAFYRNILEEPDFPFHAVLNDSAIGDAILRHFGIENLEEELRLDDAFCVHYNTDQEDTSGAKHLDPSDVTVNICLEKTAEVRGSQVLFYGTQVLTGQDQRLDEVEVVDGTDDGESCSGDNDDEEQRKPCTDNGGGNESIGPEGPVDSLRGRSASAESKDSKDFRFSVEQVAGTATIHWGHHPHETLAMEGSGGRRTNIILTYCYTDPTRSDVGLRSCYAV